MTDQTLRILAFTDDLKMINLVIGAAGFSSSFPSPYCSRCGVNFDHFKLWQQTSSKLSGKKLFLNCSHAPVLHSPEPALYFAPPPPLILELGLTNLLMNLLYTIDPSYEEQLFGVVQKRCQNKVYSERHCPKILRSVERIKAMLPASCGTIL